MECARWMALLCVTVIGVRQAPAQTSGNAFDQATAKQAQQYLADGKRIFRFDTFGSEISGAASSSSTRRSAKSAASARG